MVQEETFLLISRSPQLTNRRDEVPFHQRHVDSIVQEEILQNIFRSASTSADVVQARSAMIAWIPHTNWFAEVLQPPPLEMQSRCAFHKPLYRPLTHATHYYVNVA